MLRTINKDILKFFINYLWSLFGLVIPFFIALLTVPFLIQKLGLDKFGLLTICWAIFGFVNLFDFGVSKIFVREIAMASGTNESDEISVLLRSAILLSFIVGLVHIIIYVSFFSILSKFHYISNPNVTWNLILFLSLSSPVILIGQVSKSLFDGLRLFNKSALIQSISSSAIFIGPVIALALGYNDVSSFLLFILIVRMTSLLLALFNGIKWYVGGTRLFSIKYMKLLLSKGISVTLSSASTPILTLSDRFFLSTIISSEATGVFSAPAELISRVFGAIGMVSNVLYPEFSINYKKSARHSYVIFLTATKYIALLLIPIVLIIFIAAPILSHYVYGSTYKKSFDYYIFLFSLGYAFNCLAQIPVMYLYTKNLIQKIAFIQFIEILIYLPVLYLLITIYGILGAVMALSCRLVFDCIALYGYVIYEHYESLVHD